MNSRYLPLILAAYMLLGGLFPGSDYDQLVRTGTLFRHYEDHQRELQPGDQSISFIDFFWLHYLQTDRHTHAGGSSHSDLPFQNFNPEIQFAVFHPFLKEPNPPLVIPLLPPGYQEMLQPRQWQPVVFHPPLRA